jgi:hypothetical protein
MMAELDIVTDGIAARVPLTFHIVLGFSVGQLRNPDAQMREMGRPSFPIRATLFWEPGRMR